jgi:prepilin-type N-terminal cleavage/methylation domain-containing protein
MVIIIKSEKAFTLIELMVVVVIIGILAAIAIPNFFAMQNRAKESDVKSVAHVVLLTVEEYKTRPDNLGIKPATVAEMLTYLPTTVASKRNPFSLTGATYGGGELVDGNPGSSGRVGYIFTGQGMPYQVIAAGTNNIIILTLSAES